MTTKTVLSTTEGTNRDRFERFDWFLLLGSSKIFGASFLFMAIGLDYVSPGVVTFGRIGFGFLALSFVPATRTSIDRKDWPRLVIVGLAWMGIPLTLYPIAQQYVDSAIAGMLNGATPLATALIATVLLRRLPGRRQLVGIVVGFTGIVLIGLPSVGASTNAALGVSLILVAVMCYGIALNVAMPLVQTYGSLPVLWRSQFISLVATFPFMLYGLKSSTFDIKPVAALVVLGVFGTGVGFVAAATLSGRVGATRASVLTYIATPVAIALGVVFRSEGLLVSELVGAFLTLAGAWFASRADR